MSPKPSALCKEIARYLANNRLGKTDIEISAGLGVPLVDIQAELERGYIFFERSPRSRSDVRWRLCSGVRITEDGDVVKDYACGNRSREGFSARTLCRLCGRMIDPGKTHVCFEDE